MHAHIAGIGLVDLPLQAAKALAAKKAHFKH
jgi:hypothetical protein